MDSFAIYLPRGWICCKKTYLLRLACLGKMSQRSKRLSPRSTPRYNDLLIIWHLQLHNTRQDTEHLTQRSLQVINNSLFSTGDLSIALQSVTSQDGSELNSYSIYFFIFSTTFTIKILSNSNFYLPKRQKLTNVFFF